VFYVNLPVGVVALVALIFLFPHLRPPRRAHVIDYAGALTLVAAVAAILLALSWGGHEFAWTSPQIVGLLLLGLVLAGLFVRIERRAVEPIIPLTLFHSPIISVSIIAVLLTAVGMFGTILFVPLFIQGVIGTSATRSGLALTPMMVAMIAGSTLAGQIVSRSGRYRMISVAGISVMLVGMFMLSTLGVGASYADAVRDMVVMGFGLGTTFPIFTLVVQNAVPYPQLGAATAMTQFSRSIGGTLGAAIFGSLLVNRYTPAFFEALDPAVRSAVPAEQLAQLSNPQSLLNPESGAALQRSFSQLGPQGPALLEQVTAAIRTALALAIHEMFLLGAGIVFLSWIAVWFLREIPLRKSNQPGHNRAVQAGQELAASELVTDLPPIPESSEVSLIEDDPRAEAGAAAERSR
jgi:MFS family permease